MEGVEFPKVANLLGLTAINSALNVHIKTHGVCRLSARLMRWFR
jgi:hypothetical protein